MKHIVKTNAPNEFICWCDTQKQLGVNCNYKSLPKDIKDPLHKFLLTEQGSICGYTMKRVDTKSSHVEHIKPQHVCISEGKAEDLEYCNLIACYPRSGMKAICRYGAQKKDNWRGDDFLSPLNDACELRFIYYLNGEIEATRNQRQKTLNTISVLKLDEPSLTNDRKTAIQEFVFGVDGASPLTPNEAKTAIDLIYKPNDEGLLHEFCIAIHDALYEYIDIFQ